MSTNEEMIEAYLTGSLNDSDKMAFEGQMRKDHLLQNEVDLQNDVIEALKSSRKAQLKARLNNLDVSGGSTGVSSAVKIAASFITVGILGAGVYYMTVFSPKPNEQKLEVSELKVSDIVTNKNENSSISNSAINEVFENSKSKKNTTSIVRNNTSKKNTTISNEVNSNAVAHANVPNASIADSDSERISRDLVVPTGEVSGTAKLSKSENVDIDINSSNKKDFSYKFISGKLYLYGDFNDQPYDLWEFNTSSKTKRFFLKFESKFYELNPNQTKVTKLKEVKDSSVLESLNK